MHPNELTTSTNDNVVADHPTLVCYVAGLKFTDAAKFLDDIKVDDVITLHHELENPTDPNAVRLEWNGRKLGYIPKAHNGDISRGLAAGVPYEAFVNMVNPAAKSHISVEIRIYKKG